MNAKDLDEIPTVARAELAMLRHLARAADDAANAFRDAIDDIAATWMQCALEDLRDRPDCGLQRQDIDALLKVIAARRDLRRVATPEREIP